MKQYHDLLNAIIERGTYKKPARPGMPGTRSLFGYQFRHDLKTLPVLTTKKIYWKGVIVELLWFLKGDTNIKYLIDNNVNIWNQDAYNYYCKLNKELNDPIKMTFDKFIENIKTGAYSDCNEPYYPNGYNLGDCGFQYGKVWRNFNGKDQIKSVIESLKKEPYSRRHIVSAIDPANDTNLALYWCHAMFQFNCRPIGSDKYYLDCQLYQRSADVFLGVPMNIASYAVLTCLIAKIVGMEPGEFVHTFGDVHIYDNHKDAVSEQLGRNFFELPTLNIKDTIFKNQLTLWKDDVQNIDEILSNLKIDDFELVDYQCHPTIKAELSTGMVV